MDTAIIAAFIGGFFLGAAVMLGGLFLLSMWAASRADARWRRDSRGGE